MQRTIRFNRRVAKLYKNLYENKRLNDSENLNRRLNRWIEYGMVSEFLHSDEIIKRKFIDSEYLPQIHMYERLGINRIHSLEECMKNGLITEDQVFEIIKGAIRIVNEFHESELLQRIFEAKIQSKDF